MVLGCLHTGEGHIHLEAFTAIAGIPCVAERKFRLKNLSKNSVVDSSKSLPFLFHFKKFACMFPFLVSYNPSPVQFMDLFQTK